MTIVAKAPTRIDLAGGTLDLWPLYLFLEESVTINVAIDLYATATVKLLPGRRIELFSRDQNLSQDAENFETLDKNGPLSLPARLVHHFAPAAGLRLETECQAPAGSGLGGSSALAVAVAGALNRLTGRGFSYEELIAVVRDVEAQVIGIPTGTQDYYAAMFGGFNAWHYRIQKVEREPYSVPLSELADRVLLFYSGLPRFSGINNWHVFKNKVDGQAQTVRSLEAIRNEAFAVYRAIKSLDWAVAYEAIEREWLARKAMAPNISSPEVEEILKFGKDHGARTGRVCGAGGGGCLILLTDPQDRDRIASSARERKLPLLDFHMVSQGLTVLET